MNDTTPPGYEEYAAEGIEPLWPEPVDIAALAATDPEPPAMLIDDWMPVGYATLLAGHGGIGKSAIALHLSVCIATGQPFFGLPVEQRRALYLSCEDRTGVLHWRLARICAYLGIDLAELVGRLDILDLVGNDAVLYENKPHRDTTITPPFAELRRIVGELDIDLLVVDGVADVFGGNENSRSEVKQFVNKMVSLVPAKSGAVLLVAHVNKPTAQGTSTEGYSGSTGWHNSARARWYLYPETERTDDDGIQNTGRLRLELQKSNLGRADQAMTFQWDEAAHLFVGQAEQGLSHFDKNLRDEEERDGILAAIAEVIERDGYVPAAKQGSNTAFQTLEVTESQTDSMKKRGNRGRFNRHIQHLVHIRELEVTEMRRKGHRPIDILVPKCRAK